MPINQGAPGDSGLYPEVFCSKVGVIHLPPASGLDWLRPRREAKPKGGVTGWHSSRRAGKSTGRRTEIKGWKNLWDTLKGNFYILIFVSTPMALKWRKLMSLTSRREDDSGVLLYSHFPGVGGSFTLDASGGPCLLRPSAHTGEKLW